MLQVRELDHVVLNVTDIRRSLRFYTEVLGLRPERLAEYERGEASFPSLRLTPETIIDLFAPAMHAGVDPREDASNVNHICLVVEGTIESIRHDLDAAGVAIERGPMPVYGARGIGLSVYVRDPDRNVIELRSYA